MGGIGKTTTITDLSGNVIANVDAIGDISISTDEIEDTVYSTQEWKTFVQGLKDGGTFDLTVNYDKDSTGNTRLTSVFRTGTSVSVKRISVFRRGMFPGWQRFIFLRCDYQRNNCTGFQ